MEGSTETVEGVFGALGAVSLLVLLVVGVAAGWIAGRVTGRDRLGYMVLGAVGAVALPFLLAALGLGIVAAGGLLILLVAAGVGALILIAIGRMIFGEGR